MRGVSWRAALIVIVIVVSAFYLVPPSERINLGLDLQGGIHLVLEVQSEKAVESKMSRYFTELRNRLSIDDIRTRTFKRDGLRMTTTLHRPADRGRFLTMMQNYSDLTLEREEGTPPTFVYFLSSQQVERTKEQAIIQALETIRNRIDQFGVREPTLQRQGERRIIIQLPGVEDPSRAKSLIGKTALLEFKMVDNQANVASAQERGRAPEGLQLLYEVSRDRQTGEVTERTPLLVKKEAALTGGNLTDARVEIGDRFNQSYVAIAFDSVGAGAFDRLTAANVGQASRHRARWRRLQRASDSGAHQPGQGADNGKFHTRRSDGSGDSPESWGAPRPGGSFGGKKRRPVAGG